VASGKPVILNSDGTVTEVAAVSQNIGTESAFEGARVDYINATYDSGNGKIVVVYKLQSDGRGYAVVGTVSGTSISFGTPVVFPQSFVYNPDVTYDANAGKIVIAYRGGSFDYGYSVVGTVSGTSISFGTEVVYKSAAVSKSGIAYDSSAQKVVIAYRQGSTNDGVALVGTVSGTSISFGSETTFDSGNANTSQNMSVVYDVAADKTVIAYQNNNASGVLTAIVGTVSGTSISFGSSAAANSTQALYVAGTYDSTAQKIVYSYRDAGNSDYGTAVVGTVSGTSISFGTPVVFDNSGVITYIKPSYNAAANKTLIAYTDATASYVGEVIEATVSGTSLTFANQATFNSTNIAYMGATYDSANEKNVIAYLENYASGEGQVITVSGTNLTATNFIGLASAAISDTASGNINVKGGINEVASPALATGTEANLTGKTQSPYPVITYDITNSKFVVFFQDGNNFNYGTSVVVTVSGTTVTFGTPVVFNSGSTNYIDATYSESNGKHLIVYPDYGNSQQATAIVGTVSGTSISFGSEQVYDTGTANTRVSVAYNSNLDKYLAGSTPSSGTINVTVLTVSGTTVSAGTPVSLSGTKYLPNIASNESASDFVLGNNKNDNQSEAHLISVSGTVPTVETSTDLSAVVSSSFPRTGLAFLESNKFVCVYSDSSTNSMYTRTITVSGTSLSLGTASSAFTVDPNAQTNINGAWPLFKATTTSAYLYYQDDTSNYLKYVPISISGTTATSGTEVIYTSETSDYEGFLYSADAKQSLSFFQSTDSGQQTAAIAQSGVFAIGSDYYVQSDGTLSTTSSSVKVGQAISATTINMMDLT
jgi:hypothetical protein